MLFGALDEEASQPGETIKRKKRKGEKGKRGQEEREGKTVRGKRRGGREKDKEKREKRRKSEKVATSQLVLWLSPVFFGTALECCTACGFCSITSHLRNWFNAI